jgi:hypothetical protein
MGHGNFLNSLEGLGSVSNIVYGVKNVGAVIPRTACVAYTDDNVFKDDESLLMLECLTQHFLGCDGSFAVFAPITVHGIYTGRLQTAFA